MKDIVSPDDSVTCGLCGHQTSIAMITNHLERQHDINPGEIVDAPLVDLSEDVEDSTSEYGWYVLDTHCRRAIGYLSAKLVEEGHLAGDFESPRLLDMWGEALSVTMEVTEPSPIGPDPALARTILSSD